MEFNKNQNIKGLAAGNGREIKRITESKGCVNNGARWIFTSYN